MLLYGQAIPGVGRMVVTSSTNTITGLVEGLTLNLKGTSDAAASIAITSDDESIVDAVGTFVDEWNEVVGRMKDLTAFDEDSSESALLLGDPTIMRIEDTLNQMISYNAPGTNPRYNRLSRMGVSFMETGKVTFDSIKMRQALGAARDEVEQLFTTEETGLGAHFSSVLDSMTDEYDGLIKRTNDQYDDQMRGFQRTDREHEPPPREGAGEALCGVLRDGGGARRARDAENGDREHAELFPVRQHRQEIELTTATEGERCRK